jgi:hypothetical protein
MGNCPPYTAAIAADGGLGTARGWVGRSIAFMGTQHRGLRVDGHSPVSIAGPPLGGAVAVRKRGCLVFLSCSCAGLSRGVAGGSYRGPFRRSQALAKDWGGHPYVFKPS